MTYLGTVKTPKGQFKSERKYIFLILSLTKTYGKEICTKKINTKSFFSIVFRNVT